MLFRIFFNCRFYYPIFTILFLDFGLSVAQFSILNAVWAATIVLAEVPSGALADIVGRKRLLVFAAFCMLIEMAILATAPMGNVDLLFVYFLVNRVLSGLAEAAASGADEAIAYDALQEQGMADWWGKVLDVQMRLSATVFIFTMTIGAVFYDPETMSRLAGFLGWEKTFSQTETLRFPVYLTLAMALPALAAVLRLKENRCAGNPAPCNKKEGPSVIEAFKLTLNSGNWIMRTPVVLAVILFTMLFDGILRMAVTLSSQYYRMIELPESLFGVLGSLMSVSGIFLPRLARWIAENHSPKVCLWTTAGVALAGLWGMACFWPRIGVLPALAAFSALHLVSFYVSYYVNRNTPSSRRATVLSFKGLACNLAYGGLGMAYAALLSLKKGDLGATGVSSQHLENLVFMDTFFWFPLTLAVGLAILFFTIWIRDGRRHAS